MPVILKRGRDGNFRHHWYGKFAQDGKMHVVNLGVPMEGKAPESLWQRGDAAFERSRKEANKALVKMASVAQGRGRAEHLVERLIEMKTGKSVEHVRIEELAPRWLAMPRAGSLNHDSAYVSGIRSACARFARFMDERRKAMGVPAARCLYEVTQAEAGAFAEHLRASLSPKTVAGYMTMLRSAFRRFLPAGVANPFEGIVTRRNHEVDGGPSIHRKPFTAEELARLIEAAREDTLMHPLIVAAACTGMRRGDVCTLRWEAVDLGAGMLSVKTSKTGARVEIPIFAPLRAVLDSAGKDGEYIFPAAAAMLQTNPGGLTWRFKSIVARAFAGENPPVNTLSPDPKMLRMKGLSAIDCMAEGARRDHTRDAFTRYMDGASVRQIAASLGCSKGSVSGWLADVSKKIGMPVVRASTALGIKESIATHTRMDRASGQGQRAASIRDWHALRSTWVTLALSAGVPMELVRRVTGHATVDVVLKHYFRPGREQFKAVLAGALPDVLTGGKSVTMTPVEELKVLAGKIADGTASADDKARAHKLIEMA